MQVYWVVARGNGTAEAIRANVREAKARGADGLKIFGMDRDQLEATMAEAKALGLKTTTHIAVEETTAKDYAELGVDSIEHFYGIADAALDGVQHFPPEMNYSNELHRFSRAGELYAQADPAKLEQVLDLMVARNVAWSPTLSIYEASRDVVKAQNLPWYKDYLHPSMQAFFEPNLDNHGSYFTGWTNTRKSRWKQQYRIWMDALLLVRAEGRPHHDRRRRRLHPLAVRLRPGARAGAAGGSRVPSARGDQARHRQRRAAARHGRQLGRVRQGFSRTCWSSTATRSRTCACSIRYGIDVYKDGRMSRGGGIEWTHQERHPVSRADADEGSQGDGRRGPEEGRGRGPTNP